MATKSTSNSAVHYMNLMWKNTAEVLWSEKNIAKECNCTILVNRGIQIAFQGVFLPF